MAIFWLIVKRDIALAVGQGGGAGLSAAFFIIAVSLFPLGLGPDLELLAQIASGVVWVAALLAALLSLDRLFQADYEDGSLDKLMLAPLPSGAMVLAKCTAHWLTTGVPLVLISPILALLLNMTGKGYGILLASMLLGTPALSLIGAIGASLTAGIRRGGVLIALLVLPLYIPTLIFGVMAVDAAIAGLPAAPHLQLLAATLLFSLVLSPLASARALRLALS